MRILNPFLRYGFLLALLVVLTIGMACHDRLTWLADAAWLPTVIVPTTLFCMAFPLQTSAIVTVMRRPAAGLLGFGMNLAFIPALGWIVSRGLAGPFAEGINVAAAVPCALASATVWTRRAGGDDAISLWVTVTTNFSCFVITPLLLVLTTGGRVEIRAWQMMGQLAWQVVVPIVVAQLLRQVRLCGDWATARAQILAYIAQGGILIMVSIGAIKCGQRLANSDWQEIGGMQVAAMCVAMALIHTMGLFVGFHLAGALALNRASQIAVAFSGSQKTLMVGLQIAVQYYGGLAVLPMVAYHALQLLIDTLVADRWKRPVAQDQGVGPT